MGVCAWVCLGLLQDDEGQLLYHLPLDLEKKTIFLVGLKFFSSLKKIFILKMRRKCHYLSTHFHTGTDPTEMWTPELTPGPCCITTGQVGWELEVKFEKI